MFILQNGKQFADFITVTLLAGMTFIYKLWRRRWLLHCSGIEWAWWRVGAQEGLKQQKLGDE